MVSVWRGREAIAEGDDGGRLSIKREERGAWNAIERAVIQGAKENANGVLA